MGEPFRVKKDADFKDTRKRRRPVRTRAGEAFDTQVLFTHQELDLAIKALAFRALEASDELDQIRDLVAKLRASPSPRPSSH